MDTLFTILMLSCVGLAMGKHPGNEVALPPPQLKGRLPVEEALHRRRSVRDYAKVALSIPEVSQLLWAAQGITQHEEGLRTAPSAGATYPLEVYLVAGDVRGLPAGIYHYVPARHVLIRKAEGDVRAKLGEASLNQQCVKEAPAILVIAAVYARTSARYGGRAERYVDIEVGHAGENIYLQAEALGLGTVAVGAFSDTEVKRVLGLEKEEAPLYLMPVGKKG